MAVRPIDGNELYRIEKLLDTDIVRQDKVALNLLEQVLYDIQHVPTLTPPNEWVSVEEAMPPEHETVLCIVSGKPKPNITLEDAYQLGSWNKADGWIIDEWLDWEGASDMVDETPRNAIPPPAGGRGGQPWDLICVIGVLLIADTKEIQMKLWWSAVHLSRL